MQAGGKRAIGIWHRRAGKDEVFLHWAAFSAFKRPATYWHMLPEAAQARKAIWDAINPHTGLRRIDEAFPLVLRSNTREQEMMIRFRNGSTWQVVGSDNYNSLVGAPPFGVVFSEWAIANPQAWAYLRPILRENGGWAAFITTPRGDNHAKAMYDSWLDIDDYFAELLPATQTNVFTQADLEEELREYINEWGEAAGRALFEQEYLCSFEAAAPGAYFAAEMRIAKEEGRIGVVQYEEGIPVNTFWDLGIDDSMTIWFHQEIPSLGQHRFIDYYEISGVGLAQCADVLYDKRLENGWMYGRHVAPHDIKVREIGTTGKSRWETARRLKEIGAAKMSIDFEIANKPDNKEDAIEMSRRALSRCLFDKDKCKDGISALSSYRKKYDELNKVWMKTPLHDWSSHGSDGFQTFAIAYNVVSLGVDDLKAAFG